MRKKISNIVIEMGIVTFEEIESILKRYVEGIKKKTIILKLKDLEKEAEVFKILSKENSYGVDGYIAGPNIEPDGDFEIKELLVERGFSPRDVKCVDWEMFSSRIVEPFSEDVEDLLEDLEKFYDDPTRIEMRYFDLSIRYHELYRFLFNRSNTNILTPIEDLLIKCREQITKKDI